MPNRNTIGVVKNNTNGMPPNTESADCQLIQMCGALSTYKLHRWQDQPVANLEYLALTH